VAVAGLKKCQIIVASAPASDSAARVTELFDHLIGAQQLNKFDRGFAPGPQEVKK
jgi:hypothetical protein